MRSIHIWISKWHSTAQHTNDSRTMIWFPVRKLHTLQSRHIDILQIGYHAERWSRWWSRDVRWVPNLGTIFHDLPLTMISLSQFHWIVNERMNKKSIHPLKIRNKHSDCVRVFEAALQYFVVSKSTFRIRFSSFSVEMELLYSDMYANSDLS